MFCRITSTFILYIAIILQSKEIVFAIFLMMLLSYLVKIKKSPLVFFYMSTIDKIKPSTNEYVDEKSIAFAHLIGALLLLAGFIFISLKLNIIGIIIVIFVAIMKTFGIFGFCTASKLYSCIGNSTCCSFSGKRNA